MKAFLRKCLCILLGVCVFTVSGIPAVSSATSPSICSSRLNNFLLDLSSQCPPSNPFASLPVQVDGESLQKAIASIDKNEYIAVLFYAAWCPFSNILVSRFGNLSFLYPQIKHLMVEQSSATPSIFSIYGVHSVPSLLIVNQTTKRRYVGVKDMHSLVSFYKRITGLDPMVGEASIDSESKQGMQHPQGGTTRLKETFLRDPYLLLSIVFITLRAVNYFFPESASRLLALWATCIPHLNLGIFGEPQQIVERLLHLIDVKRIWRRLRLLKNQNFHKGARNARGWASSLASVSMGETSSSRA